MTAAYLMKPLVGVAILWNHWGGLADGMARARPFFCLPSPFGLLWWGRNLAIYGWLGFLSIAALDVVVVGQPQNGRMGRAANCWGYVRHSIYRNTTASTAFWGQFGWMAVPMTHPRMAISLFWGFSVRSWWGGWCGGHGTRLCRGGGDWRPCFCSACSRSTCCSTSSTMSPMSSTKGVICSLRWIRWEWGRPWGYSLMSSQWLIALAVDGRTVPPRLGWLLRPAVRLRPAHTHHPQFRWLIEKEGVGQAEVVS